MYKDKCWWIACLLFVVGMLIVVFPTCEVLSEDLLLTKQPRNTNLPAYLVGMTCCFAGWWLLFLGDYQKRRFYILLSLVLLLNIFMIPYLSDDIYRYLWDGQVIYLKISPYSYTPKQVVENYYASLEPLFQLLNSQQYYSVYPPVSQIFFAISGWLSGGSLLLHFLFLKLLCAICFFVAVVWQQKVLDIYQLPAKWIYLFALNPFVITELVGQAHSEIFLVVCLSATIYYYSQDKMGLCFVWLALGTLVKLYPIIFFPFLLHSRKNWKYLWVPPVVAIGSIAPFYSSDMVANILKSLNLYKDVFYFNSALLYWLQVTTEYLQYQTQQHRLWCWQIFGVLYTLWFFVSYKWQLCDFRGKILVVMWLYLICNPTVHPWYIIPLIQLSVFYQTNHKLAITWSVVIIPTYLYYSIWQSPESRLVWTTIEFLAVFLAAIPWFLQMFRAFAKLFLEIFTRPKDIK